MIRKFNTDRLFFIARCLGRFFIRGPARKKLKNPKNFCVVQQAKLGDMVCTTPLFAALKKHFKGSHLSVIGSAVNKDLIEHQPNVDKYFVSNSFESYSTIFYTEKFDVVVLTGFSLEALVLAYLSNVPCIIGPIVNDPLKKTSQTKTYKILCRLFAHAIEQYFDEYIPRFYVKLLTPLGIVEDDTAKKLGFSQEASRRASELASGFKRPFVGISPSAGHVIKEWPADRFASLADILFKKYKANIFIFGVDKTNSQVQKMLQASPLRDKFINLAGAVSLDELKAVISSLDMLISADSGPVYIAEAFGVATIDIVGPINETEQPPRGEKNLVVVPKRERAALSVLGTRVYDPVEVKKQAEATPVGEVLVAAEKLLKILNYTN